MTTDTDASSSPWIPTKTPGLYLSRASRRYYSRVRVGNRHPYVSLKTKLYSKAVAMHAARMVDRNAPVAKAAVTGEATNLQTLGDLARVVEGQLDLSSQGETTKIRYKQQLTVARRCWPGGGFAHFLPRKVTFAVLLKLRSNLQSAEWSGPAGHDHSGKRTGCGYSNSYVNSVLARVRNLLDLGRHHGLITHDPFIAPTGIGGSIWLTLPKRPKDLPTLEQMQQVFREMAGVPPERLGGPGGDVDPGYLRFRLDRAADGRELAEYLAYSGCRIAEATGSKRRDGTVRAAGAHFEDFNPAGEHGPTMRIRGTKGPNSDRVIDAIPDLVGLVQRMKARRAAEGSPTTGPMFRVKTCRYALKVACERVGCMRLTHHTLRHYFATVTLGAGIPVTVVADWLGHRDKGATLLKVYAHVIRQHSAGYAKRVSFSGHSNAPANPP